MPESDAETARNVEIVKRYFEALNGQGGEAAAEFYAADVVQEEFPNRFVPNGARRDHAGLVEAAKRGANVMSRQDYDVKRVVGEGNHVAVEFIWKGTLAVPLGNLPVGGVMKGYFATFIELRGGKIVSQRNYDCFEPF